MSEQKKLNWSTCNDRYTRADIGDYAFCIENIRSPLGFYSYRFFVAPLDNIKEEKTYGYFETRQRK